MQIYIAIRGRPRKKNMVGKLQKGKSCRKIKSILPPQKIKRKNYIQVFNFVSETSPNRQVRTQFKSVNAHFLSKKGNVTLKSNCCFVQFVILTWLTLMWSAFYPTIIYIWNFECNIWKSSDKSPTITKRENIWKDLVIIA